MVTGPAQTLMGFISGNVLTVCAGVGLIINVLSFLIKSPLPVLMQGVPA